MSIRVQAPDGSVVEFPDGTPRDTIKAAMQKRFGAPAAGGALAAGLSQGASFGFADELAAPIVAAARTIERGGKFTDNLRAALAEGGRGVRQREAKNPGAFLAGNIGGSLAIPVGGAGIANTIGRRAAANMAQGAAYGAGQAEGGFAERGRAAGVGAVTGAIAGEAGYRALRGASAALQGAKRLPEAERLRKAGVSLTVPQQLGGRAKAVEDRLSGLPFVGGPIRETRRDAMGTLMRAAGNQALDPIGGGVSPVAVTGREIAEDTLNQAGDAYGLALRGMSAQADPEMAVPFAALRENPQVAELLDDEIIPRMGRDANGNPDGSLDGVAIQEIKEILDSEARKWGMAPGGRRTAKAIKDAREVLLGTVERQAPQSAADYRKARQAYGMAKTVARASEKSTSDGIATPRQLGQAIRESARRFGPRDAYAQGMAPMQQLADDAATIMPSSVPDPGTAGQIAFMDLLRRPVRSGGLLALGSLYSPLAQSAAEAALFNRSPMMLQAGNRIGEVAAPLGLLSGALGAQTLVPGY